MDFVEKGYIQTLNLPNDLSSFEYFSSFTNFHDFEVWPCVFLNDLHEELIRLKKSSWDQMFAQTWDPTGTYSFEVLAEVTIA